MRILFAADEHLYTAYALRELVRLASNTWSDVTMVGVLPDGARSGSSGKALDRESPLLSALERYRRDFIDHWPEGKSPYEPRDIRSEWIQVRPDVYEQLLVARGAMKDFRVRVRLGSPAAEILQTADEEDSGLIVLGCSGGDACVWQGHPEVPQKVVDGAGTSVLLVKEDHPIETIYACLDESHVTQESLEMINQMVSIHGAELKLIALTKGGGIKAGVDTWIDAAYGYYKDKGLAVDLQFREIQEFEKFIGQEVDAGLLALWVGKKSMLDRFFQKKKDSVGTFIRASRTSVLVLR